MKGNFEKAFMFVIEQEGGVYTDDPDDPGGATKFGICKRDHPTVDIENLTLDQAREIYRRDYWMVVHADSVAAGYDLMVFDCAVNQGPGLAKKLFEAADNLAEFALLRIEEYAKLKKLFPKYGRGWVSRVIRCYQRCL